jgi:hypothetical protein
LLLGFELHVPELELRLGGRGNFSLGGSLRLAPLPGFLLTGSGGRGSVRGLDLEDTLEAALLFVGFSADIVLTRGIDVDPGDARGGTGLGSGGSF